MARRRRNRRIYYHVLESNRYLFADERDKKKLLDILFAVEKEEDWLIYAFCLTDNGAYFVIDAGGAGSIRRGIQKMTNLFLSVYRTGQPRSLYRDVTLTGNMPEELGSLEEIADCCRKVHRIPLEKGYVGKLDDYWWSSYITYTGEYEWELVDCRILFLCFSADPEVARRRLVSFHQ